MKMKKTILTGATGAIGYALIRNLIEKNVAVTVIVRPGSERNEKIRKIYGVTLVECDLSDLHALSASDLADADVFYHMAWAGTFGSVRNDMAMQLKNIEYTLDAVELAKKCGCKRFVGVGSQAEYGRVDGVLTPHTPCKPENGYGIAKLAAGQMSRLLCSKLGMEHVWTRVLSVYGPGDAKHTLISALVDTLLAGESPHCTKGEQIWDYIYSGDAAEILYRLGKAPSADGKVFCIGGGKPQKLREYMEQVREAVSAYIGKEAPEIIYDKPYPVGQVMHLEADLTELAAVIDYMPETDFQEGIKLFLQSR